MHYIKCMKRVVHGTHLILYIINLFEEYEEGGGGVVEVVFVFSSWICCSFILILSKVFRRLVYKRYGILMKSLINFMEILLTV